MLKQHPLQSHIIFPTRSKRPTVEPCFLETVQIGRHGRFVQPLPLIYIERPHQSTVALIKLLVGR